MIVLMIVDSTMSSDSRSVRLMLYRFLLNRIIGLKMIERSIMMVLTVTWIACMFNSVKFAIWIQVWSNW